MKFVAPLLTAIFLALGVLLIAQGLISECSWLAGVGGGLIGLSVSYLWRD